MSASTPSTRAVLWSVAGHDSGGGAGLSADARAAEALDVHLCPVLATITAQHSRAVVRWQPVEPALLACQLDALEDDLPPAVVKTGLLGSAEHVHAVARRIDRLRARAPVALVVDPVLGASTGAGFADAATLAAYREALLPRATLVTPNRPEAARLCGAPADAAQDVPALAAALRATGAQAVCVTGGDDTSTPGLSLDWIDTTHARGWLASPRVPTSHHHGTGCTFATAAGAALARGFVTADALVLAKMATTAALRAGYGAGQGAGPVHAQPGFATDPTLLPWLSCGELPTFPAASAGDLGPAPRLGLYAIVDRAERVEQVLAAGVRTVQLRIKTDTLSPGGTAGLRTEIARAAAACRHAGAQLFVNDHWELALELGSPGVHLGQEDLLAMEPPARARLIASGIALGISSHSLWELSRARALAPRYVACGPVWPTQTKAMPWRPQGLHNLRWWVAAAGAPVVAIGGILDAERARDAAACGADGVCVVRGLGERPMQRVPALRQALSQGLRDAGRAPPALPRPSLEGPLPEPT